MHHPFFIYLKSLVSQCRFTKPKMIQFFYLYRCIIEYASRFSADGKYEVSYSPNVLIYNTGDVMWIPPAIYKSSCTIDVQYFPFDQQECEMKFGSWTFNGEQVKLGWYEGAENVDLSDYVNSGTWDITKVPGRMENKTGDTEGHSTAQIIFTLKMRRKTLFYTVNLIIPCVLISFLSVCVFYLPADAGEKMTMCISILLALVVFLLLVSKILPPTSMTIPLIAKYLLFTFIMNIFTILITVIIINWNFRTPRTHRMADWVRVLFLNYLPRILLMKRPHHAERCNKKDYAHSNMQAERLARDGNSSNATNMSGTDMRGFSSTGVGAHAHAHTELMELSDMHQHHQNCRTNRTGPSSNRHNDQKQYDIGSAGGGAHHHQHNASAESTFHMTPETHKAVEAVRFIAAHLKNEDDYAEVCIHACTYRNIHIENNHFVSHVFFTVEGGYCTSCH